MNTAQLELILSSDPVVVNKNFLGVFAKDKIPQNLLKKPYSLIVNTHSSHQPGEHWLAVHVDESGRGFFFDSYGSSPQQWDEIFKTIDNTAEKWFFHTKRIQSYFTTVCGQYCCFFLIHISRGFTFDRIIHHLDSHTDRYDNDLAVFRYIKSRYKHKVRGISQLSLSDNTLISTLI